MNESGTWVGGLVIGIFVGVFIGSLITPSKEDLELVQQESDFAYRQCDTVREDYVAALEEANESIEYANDQAANAHLYAWMSYDEMGYALESMEEFDYADDPGTTCY